MSETRIVWAHKIAETDAHDDPLRSLIDTIAFSSADWGAARDLAWIYGIVLGWDNDEGDDDPETADAMSEIAAKFGWSDEQVARLRRLHLRFVDIAEGGL